MIEYLIKDSLYYIIPENIDDAEIFSIINCNRKEITFISKNKINFKNDEEIEVFSNANEGILYFKTKIQNTDKNSITIAVPQEYEIIQRRENKRIFLNEEISLQDEDATIKAQLIDLSVGGMKIVTDRQFSVNKEYKVMLNFENINMTITYIPKRIMADKNNNFQISGQIIINSATNKIELAQYCYKKAYEQSNRN